MLTCKIISARIFENCRLINLSLNKLKLIDNFYQIIMFQVNLVLLKIAVLFHQSIFLEKLLVHPDPDPFPGPCRFLFPVHQNIWKFRITKFAFNFTKWEPHNYQNTVCLNQNLEIVQFYLGINLAESLLELVVSLKAQIQMLKWVPCNLL